MQISVLLLVNSPETGIPKDKINIKIPQIILIQQIIIETKTSDPIFEFKQIMNLINKTC